MKTLVSAGLMCAYSAFYSPSTNLPDPTTYYPKFPAKISMSQDLNEEFRELDSGVFNTLPARASTTVLSVNKPAIELALATRRGGEEGFIALLEALRLSGISINNGVNSLNAEPTRDQGLSFPYWYLQLISRGENFDANLSLTDLAIGLSTVTNVPAAELEKALLNDLREMSSSSNPGVRFFITYLDSLNVVNNEADSLFSEEISEIRFNALQLNLLWLRLEAELLSEAPVEKLKSFRSANACDSTSRDMVKNPETVKKSATFKKTIKITEEHNSDSPANAKKALDRLVNFVKTNSGIMKLFTAQYAVRLVEGQPLVRTKNKTAGEKKTHEIKFTAKVRDAEELKCFKSLAYSAGIQVNLNPDDFMLDRKVKLSIDKVFDKKRIAFDMGNNLYANTFSTKVGEKGLVRSPVIGLPQDKVLSSGAKPILLKVPVKIETEVSILEYLTPVPGRDAEVVIDGLLAMEKLQDRNKTKTSNFYIPVQDWVDKAEGKITLNVMGEDGGSSTSGDETQRSVINWNGMVASRLEFIITGKSVLNPGWPSNIPLPPGMPPEVTNPSFTILDDGIYNLKEELNFNTAKNGVCDICRPEDGNYHYTEKDFNKTISKGKTTNSGSTFMGPIRIDRVSKKLIANIMLSVSNAKMFWKKTEVGQYCPGTDISTPDNDSGSRDIEMMPKQTFELEIPYEEKNGMILVSKSYEVQFDYKLDLNAIGFSIPATLFLTVDLKIPMP